MGRLSFAVSARAKRTPLCPRACGADDDVNAQISPLTKNSTRTIFTGIPPSLSEGRLIKRLQMLGAGSGGRGACIGDAMPSPGGSSRVVPARQPRAEAPDDQYAASLRQQARPNVWARMVKSRTPLSGRCG